MNLYLIYINLLRLIHVFGGVLWVGSAIFYLFFIEPSVKSLGPAGPKFMQELIGKRGYSQYMGIVSFLTVVSGALLYWNTSGGLNLNWITSGIGIGFTIGAVVSIVVFFLGILAIKPRGDRMGVLGKEIAMAGGPPSPAQQTELVRLEGELATLERIDFILLTIALITMATARYWIF